jgi:hypothetical protein
MPKLFWRPIYCHNYCERSVTLSEFISQTDWAFYETNGYLKLGKLLSDQALGGLQARIDAIMSGKAPLDYDRLLMQLDSASGKYNDAGEQSLGFKGPTLNYRKIQNLELDPLFEEYIKLPVFRELAKKVYGQNTPVACFRAMFMNKPSHQGTLLPWHQDAWTHLGRQPEITLWTALDPATVANGCVEVLPGSHKYGRINPQHPSGFLTEAQIEQFCPAGEGQGTFLELAPGEVVLLHNLLLHRSDVNHTPISRRAFSVCYMDGRTVASNGETYTPLFD